jgi:hypothetical protein
LTSLATVNPARPARLAALEFELAEAKARVREVGGWNAGPRVEMYQRADALPGTKYAWCQSFMNAGWRIATGGKIVGGMIVGGQMLLTGTASVGLAAAEARKRGLIVKRPLRGDHFALQLNSDSWPDHCGQVVKVLNMGPLGWLCRTVEGNTSSGSGSIDEGDGVYARTRWLSNRTIFYRVPGDAVVPRETRERQLRRMTGFAAWAAWRTGTGAWKPWGKRNPRVRPDVKARIPKTWWARLNNGGSK